MAKRVRIIDFGVPPGMGPEEAKFIQMSNFGSLLMIFINIPYLVVCVLAGWPIVVAELCALIVLLFLTPFINRKGRHLLALFYFGTLLNVHLVFVTVAVGRESMLPLLIFFTAAGVVTLTPRGRTLLMIAALAGVLAGYVIAEGLASALGPIYSISTGETATLRLMVQYSIFVLVVANALIGRVGATMAEDRLRAEQKKSEALLEQVREHDRQKTRFFQNISHELRTPLTLIIGPLESLLSGRTPANSTRTELALMSRSSKRLLRLVNQLLDISRIDAGAEKPRLERGDMASLLRSIAGSFVPYAEKKGITLETLGCEGAVAAAFDAEIVEKIVSNLLSNACKFTPAGGSVTMSLAPGDGGKVVSISVRDTGPGIPQEDLPHVFDRFYQVDGASTKRSEGTGIGLSLVGELVRIHGGSIRVTSALDTGSEFTVCLPSGTPPGGDRVRVREDAAGLSYARLESDGLMSLLSTKGPEGDPALPDHAPTVLIVEDNADMRGYIRSGLASFCRVVEASDGQEGLARVREHLPHLVIADVMMPVMDGYELCAALQADQKLRLIPVILLTAKATPDMIVKGLESGAIDYVTKPFSLEVLAAKVGTVLKRDAEKEQQALRDSLTGLLTRKAWEQDAERELSRVSRAGGTASVAFIDLDDFKMVNDSHGHQAGDAVLVRLATALVSQLRLTDVVGRYGGEEIVILLPDSSADAAAKSVERVRAFFRAPAETPACTFSAGIAEVGGPGTLPLDVYVARADAAMYESKRKGKDRVSVWTPSAER